MGGGMVHREEWVERWSKGEGVIREMEQWAE